MRFRLRPETQWLDAKQAKHHTPFTSVSTKNVENLILFDSKPGSFVTVACHFNTSPGIHISPLRVNPLPSDPANHEKSSQLPLIPPSPPQGGQGIMHNFGSRPAVPCFYDRNGVAARLNFINYLLFINYIDCSFFQQRNKSPAMTALPQHDSQSFHIVIHRFCG